MTCIDCCETNDIVVFAHSSCGVSLAQIVYVAPMKALAAEMTNYFSKRLEPLGIVVKELTGDMQLSKNEILRTQVCCILEIYCSCLNTILFFRLIVKIVKQSYLR